MLHVKIVLAAILLLVAVWRIFSPSAYRIRGIVATLCLSGALWLVGSAMIFGDIGPERIGAALSQFAVGACVGAGLLLANAVEIDVADSRWVRPVLFIEPIVIGLLTYWEVGVPANGSYRDSLVYLAHLIYVIAVVLSIIITIGSRSFAPGRGAKFVLYGIQALFVLIVGAEAVGLSIAPVLFGGTMLVVVSVSRHPYDYFLLASRPGDILDTLGAYVLVFDREGRLLEWNQPAVDLYSETTLGDLRQGLSSRRLLGSAVPITDGQRATVDTFKGPIQLAGYTTDAANGQRQGGGRWVVVLHEVDKHALNGSTAPAQAHDSRTLDRTGIIDRLRNAAADPNHPYAMRLDVLTPEAEVVEPIIASVTDKLRQLCPTIQIGRIERLALAAIVPSRIDANDLADQISTQRALGVPVAAKIVPSSDDADIDEFIRNVLTPAKPEGERRWQPKWY